VKTAKHKESDLELVSIDWTPSLGVSVATRYPQNEGVEWPWNTRCACRIARTWSI